MYHFRTEEEIKNDMLQEVVNTVDKSENSIIHDALSTAAIEFQNVNIELDYVASKIDVENLEADELNNYVYQQVGLERKLATKASTIVTITGNEDAYIKEGDIVSSDDLNYIIKQNKVIDKSGKVHVEVEAEESGAVGNTPAHTITKTPVALSGIHTVTNENTVSNGYNDEDDDELRKRYYEKIRKPITSANIYHYLLWAKEITGVGDVKVIPHWNKDELLITIKETVDRFITNGKYTDVEIEDLIRLASRSALSVKVIIIDSNSQAADDELVKKVQDYIDPESKGLGEGEAPIGAFCTVVSATEKTIDISVKVTRDLSFSVEQIKASIETEIVNYLKAIAFKKSLISHAQIGSLILNVDGVNDYTQLTVNLGLENITVTDEEVAVLGDVVVIE